MTTSAGGQVRLIFNVARGEDDILSATMDSPDQGAFGLPMDSATFVEGKLTIALAAIAGIYVGTWSAEEEMIDGTWSQGGASINADLKRVIEEQTEEEGDS